MARLTSTAYSFTLLLVLILALAPISSGRVRRLHDIFDDIGDAVDDVVDDVEDAVDDAVDSVEDVFGIGDSEDERQVNRRGPIVAKTTRALLHSVNATNATVVAVIPLQQQATITVLKPGPHRVVLSFKAEDVPASAEEWEGSTEQVPFLSQFLYTAEAPSALLQLLNPDTNASLAQAVQDAAGEGVLLHVMCTGQGAGGGLAMLLAPWATLQFPTASVDVITFGAPWAGFNSQFAWALSKLATLRYRWGFTAADVEGLPAGTGTSSNGGTASSVGAIADDVAGLVTTDTLMEAISLPNLPPEVPPEYDEEDDVLLDLPPPPAGYKPPSSDCPALLCKSTDIAITGCRLFGEGGLDTELQGLPKERLSSDSGADAVVSWDSSTGTAYIFWEGTDGPQDWFQNIILIQTDDYRPGNLNELLPGVEIHRGFYNQFASLTSLASEPSQNITAAILELSGGVEPWRVVVGGHSLGGGLAELASVWVSTVWPSAHVLVVNTGAPRVGNSDWVTMFQAVIGNAVRYVNQRDVVPALPPFDDFNQVPQSLWLREGMVLLLERPSLSLDELSWDDHSCENLYIQALQEASSVTVPAYIYEA